MRFAVIAVATFLMPCGACADPAGDIAAIETRASSCIDKDSSDVGMKACTAASYVAADKVLNIVYKAASARLKKSSGDEDGSREALKRLVLSERAWISYRDAECNLQGTSMLGGTGEGLVIEGCLFEMTKERITTLEKLAKDE